MKIKVSNVPEEACGVCGKLWKISGVSFSWCPECQPKMIACINKYNNAKADAMISRAKAQEALNVQQRDGTT